MSEGDVLLSIASTAFILLLLAYFFFIETITNSLTEALKTSVVFTNEQDGV